MGTLTVERPKTGWRDFLRRYKVVVDGEPVGALARGAVISVPVTEGMHRVRARIDWTGSNPVSIEVAAGTTVRCRVEPAGGSVKAFYQVMTTRGWLNLSVIDS